MPDCQAKLMLSDNVYLLAFSYHVKLKEHCEDWTQPSGILVVTFLQPSFSILYMSEFYIMGSME